VQRVIGTSWSTEIKNPSNYYISAYSTVGKYCSMDPRDADFKFVHADSKGYSGLGDNSDIIGIYGGSCYGVYLTDANGLYPELGIDRPCCSIILCGSFNVYDCSNLKITKVFSSASPTPSSSPSSAPGSSSTSTPSPTPAPQVLGTCDIVTGISATLTNTFDYKSWLCNSADYLGGTMEITVHNPEKDRLSVFATSGSDCSMSPNDPAFKPIARRLDTVDETIQFTGILCGEIPCCSIIVCMNIIGFPCSPTFDSSFTKSGNISSSAAAALSIGIIAGATAGGLVVLACIVALGWRLLTSQKVTQSELQPILIPMQPHLGGQQQYSGGQEQYS
jgi:hypothetical protein